MRSDNNILHVPAIPKPYVKSNVRYTLGEWQNMGLDLQSNGTDPILLDPGNDDLRLTTGAAADRGSPTVLPWCRIDADGNDRQVDGDGDGVAQVDIGALERSR